MYAFLIRAGKRQMAMVLKIFGSKIVLALGSLAMGLAGFAEELPTTEVNARTKATVTTPTIKPIENETNETIQVIIAMLLLYLVTI